MPFINDTEKQVNNKFKNRRSMAWWSFCLLSVCGIALLIGIVLSDNIASRVDSASWAITALFSVWTSIVLAYFGASSVDDVWSPK